MLPAALARAICLPQLTQDQFTPTKWDDAPTKAKFGNHLLRFFAEDFPDRLFTQTLYRRLSNTCGHIAHNDKNGFWGEFFITRATKIDFLDQTLRHPCYGDPAWTYSDVECLVRSRLIRSGVLDWHRRLLIQENEARDRAEYSRLARRFAPAQAEAGPNPEPVPTDAASDAGGHSIQLVFRVTHSPSPSHNHTRAISEQPDLFASL